MKKKNNKGIIILIGIIIIGIILFFTFRKRDIYQVYKDNLISAAKEYHNNHPNTNNYYYLDNSKLNVNIDNCSSLSGVIVKDNTFEAYLTCDNYKDIMVNNQNKYITLNGEEVLFLPIGINYVEKGYKSSYEVMISNNIKNTEGIYTVTYLVTDSSNNLLETAERKVIILDNVEEKNKYPILSLNGEETITIEKGLEFNDPGITVKKNNSIDNTATIKIEGTVDTLMTGPQKLTYIVTNTEGYSNYITRTVIVNDIGYDINIESDTNPKEKTNGKVTITLKIDGRSYSSTILPDNTKTTEKTINYEVQDNGIYTFKVYDVNNEELIKTFYIENINHTKPVGKCEVTMYNDSTQVLVRVTTENPIETYEYKLNSTKSGKIKTNTYKTNLSDIKTASTTITDIYNNSSTITCSIKDSRTAQIYTDSFGKPCIKGYVCYQQGKYRERFCSTVLDDGPRCGPIAETGCSITSLATIISRYNKKSLSGELYNPNTLVTEILNVKYPTNYGSGTTAIRNVLNEVGLSVSGHYDLKKSTYQYVKACLKKGPVLVHATPGYYTTGKHFMALLAINDKEEVFLYDPARAGNKPSKRIDNWTTVELLKEGEVDYFMCVAEKGVYRYEKDALAKDLGL